MKRSGKYQRLSEDKTYYRRHLPHYQPPGATYSVTIRLAGSLPAEAVERLRRERERFERGQKVISVPKEREAHKKHFSRAYFERFDLLLDGISSGPMWMRNPSIARLVTEAIHHRNGRVYDLLVFCIMLNHLHLVFALVGRVADPTKDGRDSVPSYIVTDILSSLKKYTALRANRLLHRSGSFWQDESYDHVIRDADELERVVRYVLSDPERAGLVQSWKDWPWLYFKPGLIEA